MGNKSGGFKKIKKTGGALDESDLTQINELINKTITDKLVHFGLISEIKDVASSTSSIMSKKASISDMVFAKSTISLSSGNGSSDVFFSYG